MKPQLVSKFVVVTFRTLQALAHRASENNWANSRYLRRFLREVTSRMRPSLASEESSSSLCSFLRDALALVASSSASSSWRFSCFIRELAFSIWKQDGHQGGQMETERSGIVGRITVHSKTEPLWCMSIPAPCTGRRDDAHRPLASWLLSVSSQCDGRFCWLLLFPWRMNRSNFI